MTDSQTIDIEQIVRERMGRRADRIPAFVFRWLRGFFHEDFINGFLRQGYTGVEFCQRMTEYLGVSLNVEGLENVPFDAGRPLIFVSNHPLGAIDGVAIGGIVGQASGGRIKYIVNDLLMNIKGLAPFCVPVNKLGGQSRDLPRLIDDAFRSDDHVLLFPAGLCSRLIDGEIRDLPWGKFFVNKSRQSQRDVVPVHFIGQNSDRFYRVAQWCKRLHLRFNLAMLFLPDEMYRSRGKSYTVRFGRPIPAATFDASRQPAQWAAWVQQQVYEL